jgi:hypothetical protein
VTDAYVVHGELPQLDRPVLVTAFEGWIDASGAAAAAMRALIAALDVRTIATFDGDSFIDFRARRPVMELRDGVNTRLAWTDIEVGVGRTVDGIDVVTLTGPEPDMRWHAFARSVTALATRLGVQQMVALGAYPFATPHTRPPRVSVTSPSREVVDRLPYLRSSLDAPAGMTAALEHSLTGAGITALGLWVQVPHYVSAMPFPRSSMVLLDALRAVTGIAVATVGLAGEADDHERRIDRLVAANDDHVAMLRQLEQAYDALTDLTGGGTSARELPSGPLPTGDDLAAEIEHFLREQGGS